MTTSLSQGARIDRFFCTSRNLGNRSSRSFPGRGETILTTQQSIRGATRGSYVALGTGPHTDLRRMYALRRDRDPRFTSLARRLCSVSGLSEKRGGALPRDLGRFTFSDA